MRARIFVVVCLVALTLDVSFAGVELPDEELAIDKRFLFKDTLEKLGDLFGKFIDKSEESVHKFVNKTEKVVKKILHETEEAVEKVIDEAEKLVEEAGHKTWDFVEKIGDKTFEVIHKLGAKSKAISQRFYKLIKKIGEKMAEKLKMKGKWLAYLVTKSGTKLGHFFLEEGKEFGHVLISEGKAVKHFAVDVYDEAKKDFEALFVGIHFDSLVPQIIHNIDSGFTIAACAGLAEQIVTTVAPSLAPLVKLTDSVFKKVCHACLHVVEMAVEGLHHRITDNGTSTYYNTKRP